MILGMISMFVTLLRFVLWLNIWSIMNNVQYEHEKNVFSAVVGWSALYKTGVDVSSVG